MATDLPSWACSALRRSDRIVGLPGSLPEVSEQPGVDLGARGDGELHLIDRRLNLRLERGELCRRR